MIHPRFKFTLAAALCAALFLCNAVQAQTAEPSGTAGMAQISDVPRIISYQGLVRGLDGKPISDGNHHFIITLYSDEQGANIVWTDTYTVATEQGVFNVLLGSGERSLPDATGMNRPLWVGVRLDGKEEMRPFSQLAAAPFSLNVADNSIATSKLQDSAVTAEKMGTSYVGGIAVNGVPVTSKGTILNFESAGGTTIIYDKPRNSIIVSAGAASDVGDSSANTPQFKKGSGNVIQSGGPVSNVYDGVTGYLPTYTAPQTIYNSHILDASGSITIQTGAGSGSTKLTITESNGNLSAEGTINSNNADGFALGGTSVLRTHGTDNIFVGESAGNNSVSGTENTAVGWDALHANAGGTGNTAVGGMALYHNGAGDDNVAVGPTAMYLNDYGQKNTAVGAGSLSYNDYGSDNTAVGYGALAFNSHGIYNTAVGEFALSSNTTGGYNTAIGYNADIYGNRTNSTAIGYGAFLTADNTILLGNEAVTTVVTAGNLVTGVPDNPNNPPGKLTFNDGYSTHNSGAGWSTSFEISTGQAADIAYTLPTAAGTSGQCLTYGTSGALSWSSVSVGSVVTDATLTGDGSSGTPLGVDLSHANTWTATQTLPATSGQGNALINSLNSATSTLGVTLLSPGLPNTFLTTNSSSVVGFNPLDVDLATLVGDGSLTALAIDLTHANTWLTTVSIAPLASDIPSLVVQQTTATSPASDIFDIEGSGGSPTKYLFVDFAGNTFINTGLGIVHSNGSGELTSSALDLVADVTGILPIANGGTNSSTALSGSSIIISDGTSIIQGVAGTSVQVLHGNASGAPTYSVVDLTQDVGSTILPPLDGGTGLDGSAAANGTLLIGNGTGFTLDSLTAGTGIIITTSAGGIAIAAGTAGTGVTTDATLLGDGVSTSLGIDLDHASTWTNKVTIAPGSSHNVSSLVIQQSAYSTPSFDVLDVLDHAGSIKYVSLDNHFNMTVNENLQIGNVVGGTGYDGHIKSGGTLLTPIALVGGIGTHICTDIAGKVEWNAATGQSFCHDLLYVPVSVSYTGVPVVIVSSEDCPTADFMPYGYYANGKIYIGIGGTANPPATAIFHFAYHVIEVH